MIGPTAKSIHASSAAGRPSPDPALLKAAQGFEAVFIREMIGSMRKAKLADDIFGSSATDSFRQMADANLADSMSGMGLFGIAELIEQQFAATSRGSKDE